MGVSRFTLLVSVLACKSVFADGSLIWNSSPNAVNLTSEEGVLMDGGFRFQLGVFQGSFVPTTGNMNLWAQNWVAARNLPYLESSKSYSDDFLGFSLPPHITAGKATYVWGFKGDPSSSEWILFRNSSWNWPGFNIDPPPILRWQAKNAVPILGQINANGIPYLMRSAAVSNVAPPTITWDQWVVTDLAGVSENGANDDPDADGTPNILEFIFGSSPNTANAPTAMPVSIVDGHLVITIPRRIDRPANLVVEVSGDMVTWNSGPTQTEVISSGLSSLVVRDLTPYNPANPKRFMRVRVSP